MNHKLMVSLALILIGNFVSAAENDFDGISCDNRIESVLIGRSMKNERVVVAEEKYKDIDLKFLWSDGMEFEGDPWTLNSLMICGKEYLLIKRKSIVKDVLASPYKSESYKFEFGTCKSQGSVIQGTSVFLVPKENKAWPKQVERIWTVDDAQLKFRETASENISCEM